LRQDVDVVGGLVGLVASVSLVVLSKTVWVALFHFATAPFPYDNPALFSMPMAFFGIWLFSVTDRSVRAVRERKAFDAQFVQSETGIAGARQPGLAAATSLFSRVLEVPFPTMRMIFPFAGPTHWRNYERMFNCPIDFDADTMEWHFSADVLSKPCPNANPINTFFSDLTEFDAMVAELQPLIDKVWRHCDDKGSRGRTMTLKVKFNDFEIITRSRSVADDALKIVMRGADKEDRAAA
jgi:hypothetical protein